MKPLFSSSKHCQENNFVSPTAGETDASIRQRAELASLNHFLIRAAKARDLTALAEILADSFHSRVGIGGWIYPLLRLGIYEDLRTRLQSTSPRYICLVAVEPVTTRPTDCDYLAGTVEMALRSTHPWLPIGLPQYPYVSNLAVRTECRRQGAAQQLLLTCERIALGWGFHDIYLHVLENNHQARRLYFKLGYRLHQVDSSWSSLLLGRPRRLLLHKRLV
ncbi:MULTISPECIES: GNAT family N-acetyltransferase [Aerosakkonema]|uniref:GNAT family N-acetyltransferase n=1 Tax=Aerosakkonema TaxID=1246629 RepID=UPI0035BABF45